MGWKGAVVSGDSHVVRMVEDAYHAARILGDSLLLLDRYFLTVPALLKLQLLNGSGNVRMEIVTKTKKSAVAFEKPEGDGRQKKALQFISKSCLYPVWDNFRKQKRNFMVKSPYGTTALIYYGDRSCIRNLGLPWWK